MCEYIIRKIITGLIITFLVLGGASFLVEMLKTTTLASFIEPIQQHFNLSKYSVGKVWPTLSFQTAEERNQIYTPKEKAVTITPQQFLDANVNGLRLVQVALEQGDLINVEAVRWIGPNLEVCAAELIKIQRDSLADEMTSLMNEMNSLLRPMMEVNALQKTETQRLVMFFKIFVHRYQREDKGTLQGLKDLLTHLHQSWSAQLEKIETLSERLESMKNKITRLSHQTAKERANTRFYQIIEKLKLNKVIDVLLDTNEKIQRQQLSLMQKEIELKNHLENTAFNAQFIQHYHVVTDFILKIEDTVATFELLQNNRHQVGK